MSGKEKDILGYDPLAWLKEEAEEAEIIEPEQLATDGEQGEPEQQAATVAEVAEPETAEAEPAVEAQQPVQAEAESTAHNVAGDFVLEERLHISGVGELHSRIQQRLDQGGDISIDASQVEAADGPSLQLLCGFAQEAMRRGVNLKWENVSTPLLDAAKSLGLDREIF